MYTETTTYKQSNWIEIQRQQFNFDNVFTYWVDGKDGKILNIFEVSVDEPTKIWFDTEAEAQAEYDRIKTILGVK